MYSERMRRPPQAGARPQRRTVMDQIEAPPDPVWVDIPHYPLDSAPTDFPGSGVLTAVLQRAEALCGRAWPHCALTGGTVADAMVDDEPLDLDILVPREHVPSVTTNLLSSGFNRDRGVPDYPDGRNGFSVVSFRREGTPQKIDLITPRHDFRTHIHTYPLRCQQTILQDGTLSATPGAVNDILDGVITLSAYWRGRVLNHDMDRRSLNRIMMSIAKYHLKGYELAHHYAVEIQEARVRVSAPANTGQGAVTGVDYVDYAAPPRAVDTEHTAQRIRTLTDHLNADF